MRYEQETYKKYFNAGVSQSASEEGIKQINRFLEGNMKQFHNPVHLIHSGPCQRLAMTFWALGPLISTTVKPFN